MKLTDIRTSLIAAAFLAAFATPVAMAQTAPGTGPGSTRSELRTPGAQLMTPEERDQFRQKMRAAKTVEERQKLRQDLRAQMQDRAREKGVTLPETRGGRAAGRDEKGRAGSAGNGAGQKLLTQEERKQFRETMRAAKAPEERVQLRAELRNLREQRAREKGITLPQRGERRSGPGGAAPAGTAKS